MKGPDRDQESGRFVKTHGDWIGGKASRVYTIWQAMKARCLYEKHPRYKYYGGKGIKICDDWMDYQQFKAWALTHGYADNLCIDRVDSDKGYEPENCRFITKSENSRRVVRKSNETYKQIRFSKIVG